MSSGGFIGTSTNGFIASDGAGQAHDVLWCLHRTFITGDEWLCSALKGGRNDGAVSVRQNVLRVVVDILPAVGAGLWEGNREERQR